MQQQECAECGCSLAGANPRRKFCTPRCKSRYHERGRIVACPRVTCPSCSLEFQPVRTSQRFCSPACQQSGRPSRGVGDPARICAACGTSIGEKNSRARFCSRACASWARKKGAKPRLRRQTCVNCGCAIAAGKRVSSVYCTRRCRNIARAAAHRAAARGSLTLELKPKDWHRICARYLWCCFYCGRKTELTFDHVMPVSRGGRHSIGNVLPACGSCNSSKNNRTIMEWRVSRDRGVRFALASE